VHLARLAELEYLLVHRVKAGQGFEYELLYDGEGESGERFLMGLSAPEHAAEHAYDDRRSGSAEARPAPGRGAVGVLSGGGRNRESAATPPPARHSGEDAADAPESHVTLLNGDARSYPHRPLAASA
jgi:hypothetical protein